LLDGIRGSAPLDVTAIAKTAAILGGMILSAPEIEDL
jgi:hypothetical protein